MSPGSGRHVSDEVFTRLYKSYAEHRDIKQAAQDAGVTFQVAKKYIQQGTTTLPAISERLGMLDQRTIGFLEAEILQTRQDAMNVVTDVSKKLVEAMKSVEIVLSSSRLYDENGEERRTLEGKPIVPLDASGVRTVLQAARDITDILGALSGGKFGEAGGRNGDTINVGITLSPDGVRAAAGKVMRRIVSDPVSDEAGALEGQFQEVVTQEAVRRVTEADAT